jgi:pimeloyl-ACP methyl ester carboxylesterase
VQHREALVNGLRLHYVEAGEGPLVVLLHGFPQFWYAWKHQIPALAGAGFRVIAPDLRGYNLSEKPPGVGSYDLDRLVADVTGLIRQAGEERAHLVGHDWGGVIAWEVAARHSRFVGRLVVLNAPHLGAYRALSARRPRQLLLSWYALAFQVPWLPEALARGARFAWLRTVLRDQPVRPGAFSAEDIERHVEAVARPGALEGGINYYRALFRRASGASRARERVSAPTLVLWGDQDAYLLPELAEAVRPWVTDLTVRHFPQASHWIMADEPDAVNTAMIDFLQEVGRHQHG